MIEVHDLTKRYGNHLAVDGVTFAAADGEIVGLLGPNGAGKTTIMRMLTGFMPPTSGTATVAGFDIMQESMDARAKVGYLPERVPLYPDMTAQEYVTYWAKLRGVRKPKDRVKEVLSQVQLLDRRHSLVRNLSKGMRQRLGLAQALVHDPQVVILDEPTIGIDPQQVIEVRDMVRALGEKHTVLFSTHILSEAEQVCDRVVIINRGKILLEGQPRQLREKLQPDEHLYIEIGGMAKDAATQLLKALPNVITVQAQGDGFAVRADAEAGTREAVFRAVAGANGVLLEIRPVAMTLEDMFLDIVGRENGQGAA